MNIPYPNGGIQAPRSNSYAIKDDRINLVVVPSKDMQTRPGVDVPYSACSIITATYTDIAANVDTTDTLIMPFKDTEHLASLNIPNADCPVSRACDRDGTTVQGFEASDGRLVT